ncbi:glycosyltransferase family 4 protein [Candidatus Soleaferrea massiliensis]|uniref:glycosyltransferase family 4 protein n=1 Tax=Candidatus Soleaferrea massiliensis TaxID=1470354 RepID=UPI0009E4865E|nr:glycosyltransferase family 4 protein [Candidatus Soleaferrea massiliensis]
MRVSINMLSKADMTKGHGVLSAYEEQVGLVKNKLQDKYSIYEDKMMFANITHYHTLNLEYFLSIPFVSFSGATVGYVHFTPETVERSLKLPKLFRKAFYGYMIEFYKQMDFLVTVNPYFIGILEKYGIPREKVTYIPNFVSDEAFFPLEHEQKRLIRMQYGIPEDKFVVMCAGQLQTRKGVFDFVEIAKRMPDVQFIWAGGFSFGKMSEGYKEIQAIYDNPPANLKFLGIVDRDYMNDLYNMSDVMFLPSFEELFPMTVLEAMNCRTPILLRDLDIYPDILFDFYLKGEDNDAFAALLSRLRDDPEFYEKACQMAYNGHLFYSEENVSKMWDDFYAKVYDYVEKCDMLPKHPKEKKCRSHSMKKHGKKVTPKIKLKSKKGYARFEEKK